MYYSHKDVEKLEKLLSKKKSSERNIGVMLLKEVSTFAESSISRRKFLLNYFGEKFDPLDNKDYLMDDNLINDKERINVKGAVPPRTTQGKQSQTTHGKCLRH